MVKVRAGVSGRYSRVRFRVRVRVRVSGRYSRVRVG